MVERAPEHCLDPEDWAPGPLFGRQVRASGTDGVLYRSVRYPPGEAAAIFWPNCLTLPITQDRQFRYRWDGNRVAYFLAQGATSWTNWPIPGVA